MQPLSEQGLSNGSHVDPIWPDGTFKARFQLHPISSFTGVGVARRGGGGCYDSFLWEWFPKRSQSFDKISHRDEGKLGDIAGGGGGE